MLASGRARDIAGETRRRLAVEELAELAVFGYLFCGGEAPGSKAACRPGNTAAATRMRIPGARRCKANWCCGRSDHASRRISTAGLASARVGVPPGPRYRPNLALDGSHSARLIFQHPYRPERKDRWGR